MCNGNINHAQVQLSCFAECFSPAQLWPCTGGLTLLWWQSCHRPLAQGAHTKVRNHRIMESLLLVQALVKKQSPRTLLFITDSTLSSIPNPFIFQLPVRTLLVVLHTAKLSWINGRNTPLIHVVSCSESHVCAGMSCTSPRCWN